MSGKKKTKTHKIKVNRVNWRKIAIIAGAAAAIYLIGSLYFSNHFYIRSKVNGVDASFKTAEAAFEKIQASADDYSIEFIDVDGNKVNEVSAKDLGVEVNYDVNQVQELLDKQTGFNWIGRIFVAAEYHTKTGNSFNMDKVKETAASLDFSGLKSTKESEDAKIEFNGSEFVVVEEVYGDKVDMQGIVDAVVYAVENLQDKIDISECYHKPQITKDTPELNSAVETLNSYLNTNINYVSEDGIISDTIPLETKATFFTWDDKFNVDFDREAIHAFVRSMEEKYDTYGEKKEFTTTSGEQITVPAGSLGWRIALEGETDHIISDLKAGAEVTRDFEYIFTAASHGEHDYGNSYVEVNLTEQHVYVYKDGEMVFDTPCVSGRISNGHGTHTGVYPIMFKKRDTILRGSQNEYESPVDYWMPFNDGQGLHDAKWRSAKEFGGTTYRTNGSHGCVNLPPKSAETIYNIVEKGWPVIVFYTGNTEAENAVYTEKTPEAKVMQYINDIGVVTLESEPAIAKARQAYNALTPEQQALVSNYGLLPEAELTLLNLKQQAGLVAPDGTPIPQPPVEQVPPVEPVPEQVPVQ